MAAPLFSRKLRPDFIQEGSILESWLFLGWQIDKILIYKHEKYHHKDVYEYHVKPLREFPMPRLGFQISTLTDACIYIATAHQLVRVICLSCFGEFPAKYGWIHGIQNNFSHTDEFRMGRKVLQKEKRSKNRMRVLIPPCPSCGAKQWGQPRMPFKASPLPLGGMFTVVREGVSYLVRMGADGAMQYEELGPVHPGKPQLLSWRGYH